MAKKSIATEYIQLAASADGIGKSINDALSGVGTSAGSSFSAGFGSVMGNVAFGAAKATGAALKEFAQSTVETGALFDSSMSQVAATMGYSVDELNKDGSEAQQTFQKLSEFAQEMGRSTKFTASESAEALNYMALAGYDAETSIKMLPNVLNLAAAGNMDLARASDMITDSQTAFGISLERTSQMVDEMAKAASTGNTSVEQLGDAFLTVGGLASELNGGMTTLADGTVITMDGVQELEVALTAMANAGIKGSEAGTHMRNMLLKLSDPTDAGVKALEEMGVAVYDESGKMKSLTDIMGGLSTAMGEMTQQEKISAISDLFNTRDVASAEALMAALSDTIVKCGDDVYSLAEAQELFGDAIYDSSQGFEIIENDWNGIAAAVTDAQGAAKNMSGVQLDNLAGDMTLFNSALDGMKIAISDGVSPILRDFVQFGTDGISRLTAAFKEDGLEGAISEFGNIVSEGMTLAMGKSSEIMNAAFSLIMSLSEAVTQNLPLIVQTGMEILINLVSGITSNISAAVPMLTQTLVSVAQILVDNCPTLLSGVLELVRQLATSLVRDGLPLLVSALPDLISGIVAFVMSISTEFTKLTFDITDILLSEFPTILMKLCAELPSIVSGIAVEVLKYAPELSGAMVDLTIQSLEILPVIIAELIAALPTIFTSLINGFKNYWPDMKQAGIDAFEQTITGMGGSQVLSDLAETIGKNISKGIETIMGFVDGFKNAGKDLMNGLINGINEKINDVRNALGDLGNSIKNQFTSAMGIGSPSKVFAEYGGYIDEGLAKGITAGTGMVSNASLGLVDAATNPFASHNYFASSNSYQPAFAGSSAAVGNPIILNLTLPVNIGQKRLETIVMDAINTQNYISGGR